MYPVISKGERGESLLLFDIQIDTSTQYIRFSMTRSSTSTMSIPPRIDHIVIIFGFATYHPSQLTFATSKSNCIGIGNVKAVFIFYYSKYTPFYIKNLIISE